MRRLQKGKGEKPKKKTEPLAEGIIPLDSRGRRSWSTMSDDAIVEYAFRIVQERKIDRKNELRKLNSGLYYALWKKGLLDSVGFEGKRRDWTLMNNDELVEYAKEFISREGITSREKLRKADSGLYSVLWGRKLLERVIPESAALKRRDWKSMSDKEIVEYAKHFIIKKGISSRRELEKKDSGLYLVLRRRRLLDAMGFERKHIDWASMDDGELVAFTEGFMAEKSISGRTELRKEYNRLYDVLRTRRLLDAVGFEGKQNDWASMSDDELMGFAQGVLSKRNINSRRKLAKKESALYDALRKRRLLDRVFPESAGKRRPRGFFSSMSDEELVDLARGFIEERRITGRNELGRADASLREVLRKRKLLDFVFAPIESQQQKEAVQQVVEAMKEFDS